MFERTVCLWRRRSHVIYLDQMMLQWCPVAAAVTTQSTVRSSESCPRRRRWHVIQTNVVDVVLIGDGHVTARRRVVAKFTSANCVTDVYRKHLPIHWTRYMLSATKIAVDHCQIKFVFTMGVIHLLGGTKSLGYETPRVRNPWLRSG